MYRSRCTKVQDGWKKPKNGAGKELVLESVSHESGRQTICGEEDGPGSGGAPRRAMRDINKNRV